MIQTEEKTKNSVILDNVRSIIKKEKAGRDEKLQAICDLLYQKIDKFDWVGFYLVDPGSKQELILGPFRGEATEHTRISFGKGICGQAAETHETFIVQDVAKADNYLSCSIDVKAEVVVPVMKDDTFVAELDIDSHTRNAITGEHREMLEEICDITAQLF